MEDLQTPEADVSTVIDTEVDGVRSGGGKPAVEQTAPKPDVASKKESVRDSLEAEAKKLNATVDKPKAEPKVAAETAAKPEEDNPDDPDTDPAPKADGSEQEAKTSKPSEGRKTIEAPARFLPRAKELWRNVPNEVRTEWQRAEQEREQEISQYREAKSFRDELAPYEQMASKSGTTVKDAFSKFVNMEGLLRNDPTTGFRELMSNMQMHPVQAIAHIMKAANFTPQQLAEHMQREPDVYNGLTQARPQMQPQQQQQQERQPDPEVAALKQEMEAMRAERVANDVIKPFAEEYPEYFENEQAIAKILQSGIIEQIHGTGLSPRDKLEAALFMVAPGIRRSNVQTEDDETSVPARPSSPAVDLRGGKSVKSSPGGVTETIEPDRKMSMRDMLEEEARKIARRA